MRQRYRDLYSIYKSWTENEMTIEALLKDIKKSNEQIVSLLHNSRVVPMTDEPKKLPSIDGPHQPGPVKNPPIHGEYDPVNDRIIPPGPPVGYRDPSFEDITIIASDIRKKLGDFDLDGKDVIVARIVYAALAPFYRPAEKPAVQNVAALQVAISEIMRGKHVVFEEPADKPTKPSKEFLRSQVKRCIIRGASALNQTEVDDIADNVMELLNGSR